MGKDEKKDKVFEMTGFEVEPKKVDVFARKKFHYEGGRWFCNICNDVGVVDPARNLMRCQGCGATETADELAN